MELVGKGFLDEVNEVLLGNIKYCVRFYFFHGEVIVISLLL